MSEHDAKGLGFNRPSYEEEQLRDAVVEQARLWRAEKWNIFQAQRLDAAVAALEREEE